MYNNDQEYGWKSYDNQGYDDRQYNGAQTGRDFQEDRAHPIIRGLPMTSVLQRKKEAC